MPRKSSTKLLKVPKTSIDSKYNMIYLQLGRGKIVRTKCVYSTVATNQEINLDLDKDGQVLGIEVFNER